MEGLRAISQVKSDNIVDIVVLVGFLFIGPRFPLTINKMRHNNFHYMHLHIRAGDEASTESRYEHKYVNSDFVNYQQILK